MLWLVLGAALAEEPWLVRVDSPGWEKALVTSHRGSLLLEPPGGNVPWRYEPLPVTDEIVGDYALFSAGDVLGVGAWHDAGFRGQGVKAAIFDVKWNGVELDRGDLGDVETHDCYAHQECTVPMDTLRPRFSYEVGVHGMACAEVLRDMAPDAELHLVRVNGLTTFENAVSWAIREGIDVISLSMSFFNDSFYTGEGSVSDAVQELVDAGILLVTSAGNYAGSHYMETFRDLDGDGFHEFPWGSESLPIELPEGDGRALSMNWDEYDDCGRTDLDLVLYNRAGNRVGFADRNQNPEGRSCRPVERVDAYREKGGWYWLKIHRRRGVDPVFFDVITTKGSIYRAMAEGSVPDPGAHPRVLTVGAVRADGYLSNDTESFSSQGPTHGGVSKPDLVAPDGVSTSVYGPSGFFGTSASAPVVAGAVALWMSRDPSLGPYGAANRLRQTAVRETSLWEEPDQEFGAGRLVLRSPESQPRGCRGTGSLAWWFGGGLPLFWFRRQRAGSSWMR